MNTREMGVKGTDWYVLGEVNEVRGIISAGGNKGEKCDIEKKNRRKRRWH